MKIEVNYVFRENDIDPLYERIGIEVESDIEIEEAGVLDLNHVIGASEFYELTQVYMTGGHVFYIDLLFTEFKTLWMQ